MHSKAEAELKALLRGHRGSAFGLISLIIVICLMLLKLKIIIVASRYLLRLFTKIVLGNHKK